VRVWTGEILTLFDFREIGQWCFDVGVD